MLSLDFLRSEGVEESLIKDLEAYRSKFPVTEADKDRVPVPHFPFFGKEVWEDALSALLCGQNLLLVGPKATGKNVLFVYRKPGTSFFPPHVEHFLPHQYGRISHAGNRYL